MTEKRTILHFGITNTLSRGVSRRSKVHRLKQVLHGAEEQGLKANYLPTKVVSPPLKGNTTLLGSNWQLLRARSQDLLYV
jgi:hypothetical protein